MLYGRLPNIIEFFLIIFSKLKFNISLLKTLVFLFLKLLFKSLDKNLSFSISIRLLGSCLIISLVRFPVPGPISTIFFFFNFCK